MRHVLVWVLLAGRLLWGPGAIGAAAAACAAAAAAADSLSGILSLGSLALWGLMVLVEVENRHVVVVGVAAVEVETEHSVRGVIRIRRRLSGLVEDYATFNDGASWWTTNGRDWDSRRMRWTFLHDVWKERVTGPRRARVTQAKIADVVAKLDAPPGSLALARPEVPRGE